MEMTRVLVDMAQLFASKFFELMDQACEALDQFIETYERPEFEKMARLRGSKLTSDIFLINKIASEIASDRMAVFGILREFKYAAWAVGLKASTELAKKHDLGIQGMQIWRQEILP